MKNFAQNERKIENALSNFDERVFYDFLFMNIKQSQQKIELHLTQISPTRLKLLVDKTKDVTERFGLNENDQPTLLRVWLPTGETQGRKDYLSLVRCIFQEETYSYERFLGYCMTTIRKAAFIQDNKNILFAVEDIAAVNYVETKSGRGAPRTQIILELIKEPAYRIYISEFELFYQLKRYLEDGMSIFTPYLGQAQMLANLNFVGVYEAEEIS